MTPNDWIHMPAPDKAPCRCPLCEEARAETEQKQAQGDYELKPAAPPKSTPLAPVRKQEAAKPGES